MAEENRETDFDSSAATLARIDRIINFLHTVRLDPLIDANQYQLYINTLDRLFIEAVAKMTPQEEKQAKRFRQEMSTIKTKWQKDINLPTFRPMGDSNIRINNKFFAAWNELLPVAREYEVFLMKTMDKHNMLLRDKARVEDGLV